MEIKPEDIQRNIQLAQKGDQQAFTFLLDLYWNEVYGFMLKRTENEADTDDIVIQTFAKAFDKITTYNPEFGLNTWLIAIAKNVHIDLVRKKKRNLFVHLNEEQENNSKQSIKDEAPTAEDNLITEQNLAQLQYNIKKLKPIYQEIIQLRYFNELSYLEIADTLNEPLNNVKVKLLRAKKLLAEIIKKNTKNPF